MLQALKSAVRLRLQSSWGWAKADAGEKAETHQANQWTWICCYDVFFSLGTIVPSTNLEGGFILGSKRWTHKVFPPSRVALPQISSSVTSHAKLKLLELFRENFSPLSNSCNNTGESTIGTEARSGLRGSFCPTSVPERETLSSGELKKLASENLSSSLFFWVDIILNLKEPKYQFADTAFSTLRSVLTKQDSLLVGSLIA